MTDLADPAQRARLLEGLVAASLEAGAAIWKVFQEDFDVLVKADASPAQLSRSSHGCSLPSGLTPSLLTIGCAMASPPGSPERLALPACPHFAPKGLAIQPNCGSAAIFTYKGERISHYGI